MNAREETRLDAIQRPARSIGKIIGKLTLCLLVLVFGTRLKSTPEGEAETYYVVGIAQNDTLKVRSSPGQKSRIVATLRNGDGGIRIIGKIVMNGTDDWVPIVVSGVEGWVRPKFLDQRRDEVRKSQPAPTREGLIGELIKDCQNQLIPIVNLIENGRALRALGDLCPDSTPPQRATVRRALHLMVNDEFLDSVKRRGGISSLAPSVKAVAVSRDPSLVEDSCLLDVIDETVVQILTHPFGF